MAFVAADRFVRVDTADVAEPVWIDTQEDRELPRELIGVTKKVLEQDDAHPIRSEAFDERRDLSGVTGNIEKDRIANQRPLEREFGVAGERPAGF